MREKFTAKSKDIFSKCKKTAHMVSKKFLIILIVLLTILSAVASIGKCQEAPIHIVNSKSDIAPNPATLDQPIQLTIAVYNLNQSEISCTLRTSVVGNISIYPSGDLNVTVLGIGHGYGFSDWDYALTYFQFTITPDATGEYPITIELWYEGKEVDFYSKTLKVKEGVSQDILSYDFRVALVYFTALATIGIVYLKVFQEEGKFFDIIPPLVFYFIFITPLVWFGYLIGGFSIILSPSIGKIELILAVTFIFCWASLIFMKGKLGASLVLANVIVFLITLPIIIDWLFIPNIPSPETLLGRIVWQLIEIALSTIIGTIITIIFKRKSDRIQ